MESILIVSGTDKGTLFFIETVSAVSPCRITAVKTCGEARRLLMGQDFDLLIVNAPLRDETGEDLARYAAGREATQVILVVKNEFFEAVSAVCEGEGVLTVSKPLNKAVFWSALSLAKSACSRIKGIQRENARLKQKIEDIRVIDRAKCVLISSAGLCEEDAHRYIEKQAMDRRTTKRVVAEGVLEGFFTPRADAQARLE